MRIGWDSPPSIVTEYHRSCLLQREINPKVVVMQGGMGTMAGHPSLCDPTSFASFTYILVNGHMRCVSIVVGYITVVVILKVWRKW